MQAAARPVSLSLASGGQVQRPFHIIQNDIEWHLHRIAAIQGLCGRERPVLIILVGRSASSAIPVIRTTLSASFDPGLHVYEHLAKLWSFQRIREMVAEDVPKAELTVGLERHPKKLRRVSGKISFPVDADDPKWPHLFVEPWEIKLAQRDARADLLFCCREFTNRDASALFLIFEDSLIERADAFFVRAAQGRDGVLCLNFFDIEAQALDTRTLEEVVDFLGVAKARASPVITAMTWKGM